MLLRQNFWLFVLMIWCSACSVSPPPTSPSEVTSKESASQLPEVLVPIIPPTTPQTPQAPESPSVGSPSFSEVPLDDLKLLNLADTEEFQYLSDAVAQSLRYYKRLKSSQTIDYPGHSYTVEEVIKSLQLLQKLMGKYQNQELLDQIRQKFLFFESKNPQGRGLFTGYYEPILDGSFSPTEKLNIPLYERPNDMITVDLSLFNSEYKSQITGRLQGNRLIPYDTREEIVYQKSLEGRALPLVYVDEIEQFFLQIQGSGLVRLPDRSLLRLNYAAANGRPYRAIGNFLKNRIPLDQISLQSLKRYLRENPQQIREILSYNPSYTFFRRVDEGPLGNIEVPLVPKRSIAMDSRLIPKGSLAFIITERPQLPINDQVTWTPFSQFVMVQDTGGAIRGHGRVDIFWGNGPEAETSAGLMKREGRIFLLIAKKEFLK